MSRIFVASNHLDRTSLREYYAEFIGMIFFLFITIGSICSSAMILQNNNIGRTIYIALSFGITIMCLCYANNNSSNQFNPAVTSALALIGKVNPIKAVFLTLAQFFGAIVGVALVKAIWPSIQVSKEKLGANILPEATTEVMGFFGEFLGTTVLSYVIAGTAIDKANTNHAPINAPQTIGLTVFLINMLLIPLTSCGLNPARSLGSAVVSGEFGASFWVFFIGPYLGGITGMLLHYFPFQYKRNGKTHSIKVPEKEKQKENEELPNSDIEIVIND